MKVELEKTFPMPAYPAPDLPAQFNRPAGGGNPPNTPIPRGSGAAPLDLRGAAQGTSTASGAGSGTMSRPDAGDASSAPAPGTTAGGGGTASPATTDQPAAPAAAATPPNPPQTAPTYSMPAPTEAR